MLLLHASADQGRIAVWGETNQPGASPARRRGMPARSPFDPGAESLRAALEEAGWGPADLEPVQAVAWLPTVAGRPTASSPMIAENPPGAAELAPWTVAAVELSADRAVDLLAGCVGKTTLVPGLGVGRPLAYWSEVLRFAAALVARQRYLPGVVRAGEAFQARWEPVLTGPDVDRRARLARAQPSAARALVLRAVTAGGAPTAASADVLDGVLAALVDELVRGAVQPPTPRRAGRKSAAPAGFDSLHDQWAHALQAADATLRGDPGPIEALAAQVREWRQPVDAAAAAPFRLCFRLEEPAEGDDGAARRIDLGAGDWHVRYLLQAADDPSLLVPAAQVWQPRGRAAKLLARDGFHPRDYLLASLGQAAAVSPQVEDSLRVERPTGYTLDAAGAHAFLNETAYMLEQAGIGVLLPAWWSRKGTKLRLAARAEVKGPKLRSSGGMSLEEIITFRWKVALGDQTLTRAELDELARLKQPLVRVRGQWVQLDAEEIQAALAFWKSKGEGKASVRELLRMALGAGEAPGGLDFEGVKADGWLGALIDRLEGGGARFEELPPPDGFEGTLRPYQGRGYAWMAFLRDWGLGACLADDMGLGKTVQTLALIQRAWESSPPKDRRPTLLVCPMSVVGNWRKEAGRFTPGLPVIVHHGAGRAKGATFRKQAGKHGLVISSYPLLHRDLDQFREVTWAAVVLDEAQNIKNPQTKQAQAARALPADFRAALTGTPVENNVGDLWSIMEFLNPGLLGSQAEFRRTFFLPIQAQRDPEATRRLNRITAPFVLRRLKTDRSIIADLPEKNEQKVFCTLTREQASLYEAVVRDAAELIEQSEGIQRKGVVLATLSKLKQVCNHPAQFLGDNSAIAGRSGKLARLTEMLEEALAAGDRTLIFSQFAEMGELIRRHVQDTFGREVLFLHGGVPKGRRDRMVERFQDASADAPPVFVLSLKAGGTGLNLTAASHVFHFDRWWNPAVENQATDRAFRIGQRKNVQVHKFVCVGTLEEKVDDLIAQKAEIAGSIVGGGEDWLTRLSTRELKDVMMLRREAVAD